MIHSSDFQPRVYPYEGTFAPTQIDRVQEMTASVTLNRTKIEELGRDNLIDWRKSIPALTLTLRQLEHGEIEFWRQLANTTGTDTLINHVDYATTQVDIAAFETEEGGSFKSTVWYPSLRLSGYSLNIGDPEALIERSFTLVGEDEHILQGTNKYLININDTTCTGAGHTIVIGAGDWANYPSPVADPDESGTTTYIHKIIKVASGGTATTLVLTTDYTYTPDTITIPASVSGDTFKVFYSAGSYVTSSVPFTANNIDAAGISADSCTVYLETSNVLYRLQSVAVDCTFDRYDVREIGNDEVVERGVRDKTVRVTLGRVLDQWTVEEVLRGVATGYPKINLRKFSDELNLIIKIYSDEAKGTFLLGYKFTDLAPVTLDDGATLNDYVTRGVTLEGEAGFVTNLEASLA